ncbi:hypothetical protein BU17DRAFT_71416 [Hysterangium stoloniferum]|nr:hypothetical protein BU17DRAFT_71416 [Hysterangium stoloniferum]
MCMEGGKGGGDVRAQAALDTRYWRSRSQLDDTPRRTKERGVVPQAADGGIVPLTERGAHMGPTPTSERVITPSELTERSDGRTRRTQSQVISGENTKSALPEADTCQNQGGGSDMIYRRSDEADESGDMDLAPEGGEPAGIAEDTATTTRASPRFNMGLWQLTVSWRARVIGGFEFLGRFQQSGVRFGVIRVVLRRDSEKYASASKAKEGTTGGALIVRGMIDGSAKKLNKIHHQAEERRTGMGTFGQIQGCAISGMNVEGTRDITERKSHGSGSTANPAL